MAPSAQGTALAGIGVLFITGGIALGVKEGEIVIASLAMIGGGLVVVLTGWVHSRRSDARDDAKVVFDDVIGRLDHRDRLALKLLRQEGRKGAQIAGKGFNTLDKSAKKILRFEGGRMFILRVHEEFTDGWMKMESKKPGPDMPSDLYLDTLEAAEARKNASSASSEPTEPTSNSAKASDLRPPSATS